MATRVEVRDSAIVSELSTHDIPLDVREASVQDFYRALPPAAILYIEDWVLAPLAAISCFFFLSFTRSDFFYVLTRTQLAGTVCDPGSPGLAPARPRLAYP